MKRLEMFKFGTLEYWADVLAFASVAGLVYVFMSLFVDFQHIGLVLLIVAYTLMYWSVEHIMEYIRVWAPCWPWKK